MLLPRVSFLLYRPRDRDEVKKKRNATTMHDLYTTTVMDRLDWISAQISNGTVFTTTDNLCFVVHSIFFLGM